LTFVDAKAYDPSTNIDPWEARSMRELKLVDPSPAECCSPIAARAMSEDDAQTTASVFKALSDPGRVRILNLLATAGEPVCVCHITPELGLSQPTVSFHLKKLVQAGLLERERRGVWAFYSVNREVLKRLGKVFEVEGARA